MHQIHLLQVLKKKVKRPIIDSINPYINSNFSFESFVQLNPQGELVPAIYTSTIPTTLSDLNILIQFRRESQDEKNAEFRLEIWNSGLYHNDRSNDWKHIITNFKFDVDFKQALEQTTLLSLTSFSIDRNRELSFCIYKGTTLIQQELIYIYIRDSSSRKLINN